MKNDVEEYLKTRDLSIEDLSLTLQQMFKVYNEIKKLHDTRKETGEHLEQLEKAGLTFINRVKKDYPEPKKEVKKVRWKVPKKKTKSDKVVEQTPKVVQDLTHCKKLIRADRKERISRGELKPPVKQTRYTKIKNAFLRIIKLMPGQSALVIRQTKKVLAASLKKTFEINGMKQWEVIDSMLEEEAKKQIEKLGKKSK